MSHGLRILGALLLVGLLAPGWVYCCNEAICASVVTKCMLTQSCNCTLTSCTCCKECFSCLSYLYDECCSCVDLCPKPKDSGNRLSKQSHVEDFDEPITGLFAALTDEPDEQKRWISFTYPIDFKINQYSHEQEKEYRKLESERSYQLRTNMVTKNCTVAYMAQCTSSNKCRHLCQSMGASSYRWFHDGCCECVGENCVNYGVDESRCLRCPLGQEGDPEDQFDDYGQEEDELSKDEF